MQAPAGGGTTIEQLNVGVPEGGRPRQYADEIVFALRTLQKGAR